MVQCQKMLSGQKSDCKRKKVTFLIKKKKKLRCLFIYVQCVNTKVCIQYHVCTFLLWCSNAFYNLKVYVKLKQMGG